MLARESHGCMSRTYLVLQRKDRRFVDVEFDRDFRFADTHVATGTGRVQDTRDEELLPHVRTLVQEDLTGKKPT